MNARNITISKFAGQVVNFYELGDYMEDVQEWYRNFTDSTRKLDNSDNFEFDKFGRIFNHFVGERTKRYNRNSSHSRRANESMSGIVRGILNEDEDEKYKIVRQAAVWADYEVDKIFEIFLDMLTDINFHTERRELDILFDRYFENNYSFNGLFTSKDD